MQVSFATSQGRADRPNEDYVIATDDAVIVLDGAGGPRELDNGCTHGVVWLVRHLGNRILTELAHPEVDPATALRQAIAHVADMHRDTCDLTHPGTPSSTVAILRQGAQTLDYLVLADSTVVIEQDGGPVTAVTDRRIDRIAPEERSAMARHATGTPEHQRHRIASVQAQQRHRNTPGGFWVAAAQPEAANHAFIGSVPSERVTRAAVLTDGAARVHDWDLLDWPGVLKAAEQSGPAAVISLVREAEAADPEGERWARTKHADDATIAYWGF